MHRRLLVYAFACNLFAFLTFSACAGSEISDVEVGHPPSERSDSTAVRCENMHSYHPLCSLGHVQEHGTLLSAIDPDLWVNKFVRIRGGRQAGQTGTVLRSGNGWVQLETAVVRLAFTL